MHKGVEKRCIGLFSQSVTPAVWDCLAQHRMYGREHRSGVERPQPGAEQPTGIKRGLSLRNRLQSHAPAHQSWEPRGQPRGGTPDPPTRGTVAPVHRFFRDQQRRRFARHVFNFRRARIAPRISTGAAFRQVPALFLRNIARARTLPPRGDFVFLNRFKEDYYVEETHDHDGHQRPDDRCGHSRRHSQNPPAASSAPAAKSTEMKAPAGSAKFVN